MRQVVETSMVAHLWAHQMQDHARNGSNFYFDGADIYSYGSHFRCASIVENREGEKAYLITTRSYSNTTAKHMHMVDGAIPHGSTKFYTSRLVRLRKGSMRMSKSDHREALFYIIDKLQEIDESVRSQLKSRTIDYTMQVVNALLSIDRWIKFWGLDVRQKSDRDEWLAPAIQKLLSTKKADKEFFWENHGSYSNSKTSLQKLLLMVNEVGLVQDTAINQFESRVKQLFIDWSGEKLIWEKYQTRFAVQDEINRKARETRERNEAIRMEERRKEWDEQDKIRKMSIEERIEKWRSGEHASKWIQLGYDKPYNAILRIHNAMIETSMGITVSPKEAIRIWPLIDRFHKNETSFVSDVIRDAKDNTWHINSYKDDIMTAGSKPHYYNRIYELRKELTAEIVGYLKKLKHRFILIPDEDDYEDGTWVMWVDDDGEAHDGRVTQMSLEGDNGFSIEVEDKWENSSTLYSGNDIGCDHVDWLESMLTMLQNLIDDDEWRLCHECGKAMSEGFVVNRGDEYYCSEECLNKHYTPEQWAEMCKGPEDNEDGGNDLNYHTTFYN